MLNVANGQKWPIEGETQRAVVSSLSAHLSNLWRTLASFLTNIHTCSRQQILAHDFLTLLYCKLNNTSIQRRKIPIIIHFCISYSILTPTYSKQSILLFSHILSVWAMFVLESITHYWRQFQHLDENKRPIDLFAKTTEESGNFFWMPTWYILL